MQDVHNYCWNCGARLRPGSNYCADCGAPVRVRQYADAAARIDVPAPPANLPEPQTVPTYPPPQRPQQAEAVPSEAMSLFDQRRRYYMVNPKWWGWGSGDILDENGKAIGHMYRRVLSLRHMTEFREANDVTITATINRKIAAIRDTFEIKDGREQLLGRVKQKILAVVHPVVWVEDARGQKILEGQGNFLGFSFKIHDMMGNTVAEIDKTDMWKDIFVGGSMLDFKQNYAVVINSDVDRRLVISLVIAIDEAIHEERKGR
ncbi:MAG: LURP-one-related family protein [Promethearchaeati archaeon SRVP18_Atabeyarchaeia-1]